MCTIENQVEKILEQNSVYEFLSSVANVFRSRAKDMACNTDDINLIAKENFVSHTVNELAENY